MLSPEELQHWADSHETDKAITEAILWLAKSHNLTHEELGERMQRIWQEPTAGELICIWERVTDNGLRSDDLPWGETTLAKAINAPHPIC